MKIPKEDRMALIDKLESLIIGCGGCESCDDDRELIKKLKVNANFKKWEVDSLATRKSITHTIKEINQIVKIWKNEQKQSS